MRHRLYVSTCRFQATVWYRGCEFEPVRKMFLDLDFFERLSKTNNLLERNPELMRRGAA